MTWFDWFLIVTWVLAPIASLAQLGKSRDPITPRYVGAQIIVAALLTLGLVIVR